MQLDEIELQYITRVTSEASSRAEESTSPPLRFAQVGPGEMRSVDGACFKRPAAFRLSHSGAVFGMCHNIVQQLAYVSTSHDVRILICGCRTNIALMEIYHRQAV